MKQFTGLWMKEFKPTWRGLHHPNRRSLFEFLKKEGIDLKEIQLANKKKTQEAESRPHYPVMLKNVIDVVGSKIKESDPRELFAMADCTLGTGGHAVNLLRAFPSLYLLGLDWDPRMVEYVAGKVRPALMKEQMERFEIKRANFTEINKFEPDRVFKVEHDHIDRKFHVVFADLGYNMMHINNPEWGFSYKTDGYLDMRYSPTTGGLTASNILNQATAVQLEELLRNFGEEPHARKIAALVVKTRTTKPFMRTSDVKSLIFDNFKGLDDSKYHMLSRVFQALRIAVNKELENLEIFLEKSVSTLRPGGIGIVITFHSLEQNVVEKFLKINKKKEKGAVRQYRKRERPSQEEIDENPQSRSAIMYVYQVVQ
eukprot:TRINITY_DN1110_c0_g1_i5.p1 TRINITY_DN1110_c0_g1~~TRINITY_DN1110_c0_g1_i5.p1  ORF type:complete len:370 (+),score=56.19 TRINITY_DN1110_c0_g1_i5:142-1251(+)